MNELITGLNGGNVPALDIIMLLTFAALLPSIVVMMSSFMRIIIILSFTRNAMGVQQTPPNMVLTGMALFLSLYIMSPVIGQINTVAYEPYKNGEITQQEAVSRMADPLKQFMLRNTEKDTLDHFVQMSKQEVKKDVKEYPLTVVVPAFMTSELKKDSCRISDLSSISAYRYSGVYHPYVHGYGNASANYGLSSL